VVSTDVSVDEVLELIVLDLLGAPCSSINGITRGVFLW
jgi:hypothetical protein